MLQRHIGLFFSLKRPITKFLAPSYFVLKNQALRHFYGIPSLDMIGQKRFFTL